MIVLLFFLYLYGAHRDLHVLTHSFPTRRSSDLGRDRADRCLHHRDLRHVGRIGRGAEPEGSQSVPRSCRGGSSLWHRQLRGTDRSEEHTSELQSLMRISYAVFCLKKKKDITRYSNIHILYQNKRQSIHRI